MVVFPNAKINIGLNILKKRTDGYHNIETIFYPIGASDILEISPSKHLKYSNTGINIDKGVLEQNLIFKTYQILKENFQLPPVNVHLHKIIPPGAGLGGGSSDASYTLMVINELFNLNLSKEALTEYARKLGADCAFFLQNKPLIAHGKGDLFDDLHLNLSGLYLLIVVPGISISTKEAYQNIKIKKPEKTINQIIQEKSIDQWKENLKNDFEDYVFLKHPVIKEIKKHLYKKGALYASLSGSGSAVYGLFKSPPPGDSYLNNFCNWIEKL